MSTDWVDVDTKLTDPAFFAGTGFHDLFRFLRDADPVHWTESPIYSRPFWSLSTYEHCVEILEDPVLFSTNAGTRLPPDGRDMTQDERDKIGFGSQLGLIDPPRHGVIRRPFNKHFSIPAVARMRETTEQIVDELLAEIAPLGEVDLVEDIAAQLPMNLVMRLMGIPESDWEYIRGLAAKMLHPQDPDFAVDGADPMETFVESSGALYEYARSHTMKRREHPTDDFATLIAHTEVEGELLNERDTGWMSFVVISAGLETTRSAATAGILELINHPDQARLLPGNPDVARTATEEIVRWVTPSKNRLRVATADTEIGDKKITKGDWVVGWIVSGNRDEAAFDRPQEFDILRDPNKHLGFAFGEHICLGRNLARLELQTLVRRIFETFPDISANGEPEWVESHNTTALKRFPVKFTPRATTTV